MYGGTPMYRRGKWSKDGEEVTGDWKYKQNTDTFIIILDEVCKYTGNRINLTCQGDSPDFNGWELIEKS